MIRTLSGWGNVIRAKTNVLRPEFASDLPRLLENKNTTYITYGCGRSYGDEAINNNGTTILMSRLNRFIKFNDEDCTLICESGVTLYDIQRTYLPRGVGLITSPGTAFITVGGAIANDVHGKNHDRVGSFGNQVLWFDLLLASGEEIRCSRGQHEAIFLATIGGLGLTGIIIRVCLELQKQSMRVHVKNEFINNISQLLLRLRDAQNTATYSVAWLDLASKKNVGRSILSTAEPDQVMTDNYFSKRVIFAEPATSESDLKQTPISLLSPLLSRFLISRFNTAYYQKQKTKHAFSQSLLEFLYPLDSIKNWNSIYGKKGFYQFQCVIPDAVAEAGIAAILSAVQSSSHVPYLAVLKTLGSEGEGLLSFSKKGFTLALDFPNKKNIVVLLKKLEEITLQYGGRIYLAKDACLSAESFAAMYPKLPEFQAVLKQVDPNKKWQSELARRLLI